MKTLLGLALASVIIIPAQAAVRGPVLIGENPIVRVEGGCGANEFRAPDGACRHREGEHREMRREEHRREEVRREEHREEHHDVRH